VARRARSRPAEPRERLLAAEERQAGEIVEDDGESHLKIVQFLESQKVL